MFAVQHGGWCASSATAESTYRKYGESQACTGGKGAGLTNSVYQIFPGIHAYYFWVHLLSQWVFVLSVM